jgi:hemolysin activation/secretion protein
MSAFRRRGKNVKMEAIARAVRAGWENRKKTTMAEFHANPLSRAIFAVCMACSLGTQALAQTAAPVASSNPVFAIRGFSIKGDNPLGEGKASTVLAPFLRTDATIDTLQKATAALEAALRDAGFGLHKVTLVPQAVGDTVTLEIVKFTIGQVTVTGNQHFSTDNIRASLPELQEGQAPNFKRLAVQTAQANENPNKQISAALKESDQADKVDVNIQVKDSRPWYATLSANNSGSPSSGKDRVTLAGGHSNLWGRDHQVVLAYTTSLEQPSQVKQWGLNYRLPLYRAGGTLGLSLTKSDVVGNFGAFSSTGAGQTKGLNYQIAIAPEGGRRSYWTVGLDDKLYKATLINGVPIGVDRRSRPLTLGYSARTETNTAYWGYNAELAFNTSGGSGNTVAAYQTEFPASPGSKGITERAFKIVRLGGNYTSSLGKDWLWSVRSQLQLSPQALISGEQLGIGGSGSIRGTSERALSGDSGLSTSVEFTSPELSKGLRFVSFIDLGWLSNRDADNLRRIGSDRLSSAGLGLRFGSDAGWSINADYGRLLQSSKLPLTLSSNAPQKGDDKLHLNFSVRF